MLASDSPAARPPPRMEGSIPRHPRESERVQAVAALAVEPSPRLDSMVKTLSEVLHVPMVLLNIVSHDTQRFLANIGTDWHGTESLDGAPCPWVVATDRALEVPDTRRDPRFDAAARGAFRVGSYYGVPVRTVDGLPVGVLCVIDHEPRSFTEAERGLVRQFAGFVEDHLTGTRVAGRLEALQRENAARLEDLMGMVSQRSFLRRQLGHDLRSLMQAQQFGSETLRDLAASGAAPELIEELSALGDRVVGLSEKLLHTTAQAAAPLPPRRGPLKTALLLRHVQESVAATAARRGLAVRTLSEVPRAPRADHAMLHRALCTQAERAVRTAIAGTTSDLAARPGAGGWMIELSWWPDPRIELARTADDEVAEAYCHEVARAHDGELRHSEREGLSHVSLSLPYV